MKLIEKVRSWLIQEKVGLLSAVELIKLVDEKILELDEPPDYLITISLKERIDHLPRLDLIKYRVENKDCVLVAEKMLSALQDGTASFEDIGLYSLNMCQILGSQEGVYSDFDWISDEVYLMNQGVKDKVQSKKDITKVLDEIKTL